MHPHLRRVIPVILVLAALSAFGYWYFGIRPVQSTGSALTASGTIAITQVQISTELGGRVVSVNANEGDSVRVGDVLVQLDTTSLQVQRMQAQSALRMAQTNAAAAQATYDLAVATLPAQQDANIASARLALIQAQTALADLEENAPLDAAQAQQTLAEAQDALKDAEYFWQVQQESYRANGLTIDATEANLVLVEQKLEKAQDQYNKYSGRSDDNLAKALAVINLAAAQRQYDSVLRELNWYTGSPTEIDQALLDADIALAQAQLEEAQREWEILKNGPDASDLALAKEKVTQSQALLDVANAQSLEMQLNLSLAHLNAAQAQVDAAQDALDLLDVQIAKLTITAPADGVLLTRVIQPGEIALPSGILLVLGLEDEKTITVYVPEERYGEISIGQEAKVSVDSFPGVSFEAVVTIIADHAEFTPRNVQTVEGRKNTVFAIRLHIAPDDRLKLGMPADVVFK